MPNRLSNDPEQSIECVLDHYDYMVNLVGIDHVAIGTDTSIGDMVEISRVMLGRTGPAPAPYLNGLESPADGKNIIRGLIARGYSDEDVQKIAGGNVLAFFRPDHGVGGVPRRPDKWRSFRSLFALVGNHGQTRAGSVTTRSLGLGNIRPLSGPNDLHQSRYWVSK